MTTEDDGLFKGGDHACMRYPLFLIHVMTDIFCYAKHSSLSRPIGRTRDQRRRSAPGGYHRWTSRKSLCRRRGRTEIIFRSVPAGWTQSPAKHGVPKHAPSSGDRRDSDGDWAGPQAREGRCARIPSRMHHRDLSGRRTLCAGGMDSPI